MVTPIIFHIDVNSAFLSWEACYRKNQLHEEIDLRDIPSVVGGSQEERHGIVLAKSIPTKKYGIQTGEPLVKAKSKCPNLVIVPPNYKLYVASSKAFIKLLRKYAPIVEQYSIDEAYCDMSGTQSLYGPPAVFANQLKDEIYKSLGFSVNIGISTNKLLAKMASDFKKPNMVHTLYKEEIPKKLWPLPVSDLFYIGSATNKKLYKLGITTIGELAQSDPNLIKYHLKKHGEMIWNYANGNESTSVTNVQPLNKGYGNSTTIKFDVTNSKTAKKVLLSLCETVAARIRFDKAYIRVVSVSITDNEFNHSSKQVTLLSSTNVTKKIYESVCVLFDELWKGEPIRQLGVHTGKATNEAYEQYNLFDLDKYEKLSKLDKAVDCIRTRYGEDSVMRASFLNSKQAHMAGGLDKEKRTGITKEII